MALVSALKLSNLTLQNQSKIVVCKHFSALTHFSQFDQLRHKKYLQKREIFGFGSSSNKQDGGHTHWSIPKMVFFCVATGSSLAIGQKMYQQYKRDQVQKKLLSPTGQDITSSSYEIIEDIPEFPVARSIRNSADNTKIKFTLYQYQTCPFCCKARAFLDYFGLNYDVIEVNSVTRKQMRWSKSYKKVPVLVAEMENGKKYQLVDSTALISTMFSFLYDKPEGGLESVLNCYPKIMKEDISGATLKKPVMDVQNRYFLMYQHSGPNKDTKGIVEERKWRKWVDDTLVHTLSPNVYRSPTEALQAFEWFDKAGDWEKHFATWERYLVIYLGSAVMWILGKSLKKKYALKNDVRESLYDEVNFWVKSVKAKGTPFMGGNQPDLADLAVYGVLSAIEGCDAFQDLLNNTKVAKWYNRVKEACRLHKGQSIFTEQDKVMDWYDCK